MKIEKYFELFAGKDMASQLDVMENLLVGSGFELSVVKNRGCITYFYTKSGVDNIFALTCNRSGVFVPIIIPKDFAERHYMKNGKFNKIIRLNTHSYNNEEITPVLDFNGQKNAKLHRVLLQELGFDIEGLEVDHVTQNIICLIL